MVQRSAVGKTGALRLSRGGSVASVFYSALDPGLLITSAHQQQQGSRNVVDRKGKGKAKDMVIASELVRKDQRHQGRLQQQQQQQQRGAKKNGSIRVAAALDFSADSPNAKQHNYHQHQFEREQAATSTTTSGFNESSNSTIESSSTATRASMRGLEKLVTATGAESSPSSPSPPPAPQEYDILSEEKRRNASREVLSGQNKLREEIGRRTSYSSSMKERRTKRRNNEEGEQQVTTPSRTGTKEGMSATTGSPKGDITSQRQRPAPSDPADALWNDIWGRWDQTMNQDLLLADAVAAVGKPILESHHPTTATKATTTIVVDGVSSEELQSSSQVSLQSDNGHFKSQFSFYQFPSQDPHCELYDDEEDKEEEKDDEESRRSSCLQVQQQHQIPDCENKPTLADISRSRIDERLLLEDEDDDDDDDRNNDNDEHKYDTMPQAETKAEEIEEKEAQRKRRIEGVCRESGEEMRSVGHVVFAGTKECQRYFAPAWDGFRFAREPPGRADLDAWCPPQRFENEGPLYDYEGELEAVPHWQDDH